MVLSKSRSSSSIVLTQRRLIASGAAQAHPLDVGLPPDSLPAAWVNRQRARRKSAPGGPAP